MTDVRENDAPAGHQTAPQSARRRALALCAFAGAAVLAFTTAGRPRLPYGRSFISPAFADAPQAPQGGGLDAFLVLSQHLTGRSSFDPVLGRRVYDTLQKSDSAFTQNVAALNTWLQSHGGVPSDTVTQALQADQPPLANAVGAIMRAWYLGLVGDAPHVQVVAYERALMFDPVRDVLTIPSYCLDAPFYWKKKPEHV